MELFPSCRCITNWWGCRFFICDEAVFVRRPLIRWLLAKLLLAYNSLSSAVFPTSFDMLITIFTIRRLPLMMIIICAIKLNQLICLKTLFLAQYEIPSLNPSLIISLNLQESKISSQNSRCLIWKLDLVWPWTSIKSKFPIFWSFSSWNSFLAANQIQYQVQYRKSSQLNEF